MFKNSLVRFWRFFIEGFIVAIYCCSSMWYGKYPSRVKCVKMEVK